MAQNSYEKQASKADLTNREARRIIQVEGDAVRARTARLKALRLEKEAAEEAERVAAKASEAKPVRSRAKSEKAKA